MLGFDVHLKLKDQVVTRSRLEPLDAVAEDHIKPLKNVGDVFKGVDDDKKELVRGKRTFRVS